MAALGVRGVAHELVGGGLVLDREGLELGAHRIRIPGEIEVGPITQGAQDHHVLHALAHPGAGDEQRIRDEVGEQRAPSERGTGKDHRPSR